MKTIFLFTALLLAVIISPQKTFAEKNNSSSAALTPQVKSINKIDDSRVEALQNVLNKYNSPLAPYARDYVTMADKHGVDWKLLPAISGLESSFGKHFMPNSYNVYGWGGGHIYFDSWEDGIDTINKTLRANYMDKWGATDVWSIGPIYAESPTWAVRVNSFMEKINDEYVAISVVNSLKPNL